VTEGVAAGKYLMDPGTHELRYVVDPGIAAHSRIPRQDHSPPRFAQGHHHGAHRRRILTHMLPWVLVLLGVFLTIASS